MPASRRRSSRASGARPGDWASTGSATRFPRLPYAQESLPEDRVLFTYAFDGQVKVAVVVGPNPEEPG